MDISKFFTTYQLTEGEKNDSVGANNEKINPNQIVEVVWLMHGFGGGMVFSYYKNQTL